MATQAQSQFNPKVIHIPIEDLAAGADIAGRVVCPVPTECTLQSWWIATKGSSAGIDNSNTAVLDLKIGATVIATKTYNTATQPPAADTLTDLGATRTRIPASSSLLIAVTQGATANLPAFDLWLVVNEDGLNPSNVP